MRNRGLRIVLLFSVLALQAVGVYRMVETSRSIERAYARGQVFDLQSRDAVLELAELRAAQQAYVAAGQGEDFWTGRVSFLLQGLQRKLAALRQSAQSPDSARALGIVADLAKNLSQIDARAREYLRGRQTIMASDLVFGEGLESATSCAARIDEVRLIEAEARGAEQARLHQLQMYLLVGTLTVGFVGLLILMPSGRPAEEPGQVPERVAAPVPDASLRLDAPPRAGPEVATTPPPSPLPDLLATARLCSDFGRVAEVKELPGLLARAAAVLNAAGIIVWMADPADGSLRPALSHGYPAEALARISKLPRDADNATAAAYRSGHLQTVRGSKTAPGALVAPLLAPTGCVGAMAAEIRGGKEADQHTQALATILAAQLASLVPTTAAPPVGRA